MSASVLAWQVCLKKTEVKHLLLTFADMLLMERKGIRGRMCHVIHWYAKANNKYLKDYDTNSKTSYLIYCDFSNLYGWTVSQKLPVNGFKRRKDKFTVKKEFIQNYDEDCDK